MRTKLKHFGSIGAFLLLISCFLWSCGEQQTESKAPVVCQRIVVSKTAKATKAPQAKQEKQPVNVADEASAVDSSKMSSTRIYDPEKRLDPFTRLFKTEKKETS